MWRSFALTSLVGGVLLLGFWNAPAAFAQVEPEPVAEAPESLAAAEAADAYDVPNNATLAYSVDNLLLFLSAVLVIFMQAGFAMVETGFNASKNAVNILFKNTMDFCIGVLLFWAIGYAIMYPGAAYAGKWFGFAGFPAVGTATTTEEIQAGFSTAEGTLRKLHPQADFLFQAAFAATAATIVSGAVAGRLKFIAYLIYSAVITALIYPVSGMWKWGGGWLAEMGFHDFAGSIVVHAVGGFAGLAGAIVLGPRLGRYTSDGKSIAMPGHSMPLAALGVFILLIGWYGFNPGSQLAFSGESNVAAVMLIAVNTTLAACTGGIAAMGLAWMMFGKPDLSMALNGVLAGLVGITANCDCVTNPEAMLIGAVAGGLVVLGIVALDKLRIDDPVGAWPVHGLCGIWGGLATGIFGEGKDIATQTIGSLAIAAWAFLTMLFLFGVLRAAGLLRVSPEEEESGLDVGEHGMHAYVA
jgi:Amt family ammonium transporter